MFKVFIIQAETVKIIMTVKTPPKLLFLAIVMVPKIKKFDKNGSDFNFT